MAIRFITLRDTVANTTTNTASGGLATFDGGFAIDRLDLRAGILLDVSYRLDIRVAVTGGLVNDGATAFGSVEAFYGVDLDPDDADADGVDAFVQLPADSGAPAVPLLGGTANTPVFFTVAASSGRRDAGDVGDFIGAGAARFEFTAGSGVTAMGGATLGSQGDAFQSVNTANLSVTYSYRAAIAGSGRRDALTGTRDADVLLGRDGGDRLAGREGSDALFGDDGLDRLYGGWNGDRLSGGRGDDILYGGRGNDRLVGGSGSDILHGGTGADTFVLAQGRGRDRIDDWGGRDRLDLRTLDAARGDIRLVRSGDNLQVIVDGDFVAVLIDTARAELGFSDILL